MIKLPHGINYAEAYLTLRCNLGCSYCINNDGSTAKKRKELTAKQWADALNRIDFGDVPLTLGGGEPTLHEGFFDLLDALRPDIQIDLLTNLTFNIDEFIARTSPSRFRKFDTPSYRSIRTSFHVDRILPHGLVNGVRQLQDVGYSVGIFGLNHPDNTEANMLMSELARESQVYFFIKEFLGRHNGRLFGNFKYPDALNGRRQNVDCRTKELLIAPDGNVYRCHRDLYRAEGEIGNITSPDFTIESKFRPCSNYGTCNPCDVKLKTNRFLKMGTCAIEVKK